MLADQHAHLMIQRMIRKVLDRRDEAATYAENPWRYPTAATGGDIVDNQLTGVTPDPVETATGADLVTCPECQAPASLDRGLWLDSTDGPVEHGRLRCAADCGPFLAPIDDLLAGA